MQKYRNPAIIMGIILFYILGFQYPLEAIQLNQLALATDTNKPVEWRIDYLQQCLYDEIENPTIKHKGWGGGDITHGYIIAQIITAMERIVIYFDYNKNVRKWCIDNQALEYINKKFQAESNKEAKNVFAIVLGYCRLPSVQDDLVAIIKNKENPYIRQKAIGALRESTNLMILPDLIELLTDPYNSESVNCLHAKRKKYIVRDAAAFALRKFGVNVQEKKDSIYIVDRKSAIDVLESTLYKESSSEKSEKILHAISRVGGEYSRKALEDYIDKNKTLPDKKELVATAEDLLNKVEVNKTKEK